MMISWTSHEGSAVVLQMKTATGRVPDTMQNRLTRHLG